MTSTQVTTTKPVLPDLVEKVQKVLLELVSDIPSSKEMEAQSPKERAKQLALGASTKAALVSGGLSLPPGPLGILTVLPDLAMIWKIQRQLVADIASCYGKTAQLNREQMIYCLFRHAASQAVRDFVVRVGERVLVRRASLRAGQRTLRRIGVVVTQRLAGRTISRWLPIVGAVGIGAYAFYDTAQVAKTAIELFEGDLEERGRHDVTKTRARRTKPRQAKRTIRGPARRKEVGKR